MSTFDVQAFVEAPSRRLLENCRKSDLQQVAAHFSLLVPKQLTKDALRQFVLDFLVAQEILPPVSRPPSPPVTNEEERMEKPELACSSESASPQQSPSSSPLTGARLKLRLARLHIEAEERALERKLRHEIELKRLDADIRLRELELTLQSRKRDPATFRTVQPAEDSDAAISPPPGDVRPPSETPLTPTSSTTPFDISKCLTLLPPFRETEVDGYFLAFERMAAILRWPRDVWPLLLTCKLTVLTAPDLSRPFKLEVDASDAGAGAVLLQEDAGGLDHPICYFSRKFNIAQSHYSTIEKETLALIWALQHFSVYVGNSAFTTIVFTDHNPLIFLHRMYNHNQRLMRWALLLQEFSLDIRHKKGTKNLMADALSRSFSIETPF
ncbi:putative LOC107373844-like protein [Nothobranchius furzeri]|uniref:LOC107373844-like protein n=1 Tax=Nothobranchius furzeri TaxID=105023 RepID=A0A9D2XC84_NOTFU|nr:putative LOC107373844-like protein [Nothobranchius furzeri]